MKKIIAMFLSLNLVFAANAVNAKTKHEDGVAAVVNSTVITKSDADKRFNLLLAQIPGKVDPKNYDALYSRALGTLIDETLYEEYAQKINITTTEQEVGQGIAQIEKQNNMEAGTLLKKLGNGEYASLRDKVKAEITWQKIIARVVQPKVKISTEEIDQIIESLLSSSQVIENEVSHIYVEVSDSNSEDEAKARINEIYNQLKEDPSQFKTLARAISDDASAKNAGYLGWFNTGELAPPLETAIENLKEGEFSTPVRTSGGWHIVKLDGKRETNSVSMEPIAQLNVMYLNSVLNKRNTKDVRSQFKKWEKNLRTEEDFRNTVTEAQSDINYASSKNIGWINVNDLPSYAKNEIAKLGAGEKTRIIEHSETLSMFYVAGKRNKVSDKLEVYRNRVRERMTINRTDLAARLFARNLRRQAYIDIREK